jgi:hypothetical protein
MKVLRTPRAPNLNAFRIRGRICTHCNMTVRIRRYERNSRMETNVEAKSWVLTSAYLKMRAFWDIAPCNLVGVDRRFRGAYCLHHHPDGGSPHFSNVSLLQWDYSTLYLRKLLSSHSPQSELEISHVLIWLQGLQHQVYTNLYPD